VKLDELLDACRAAMHRPAALGTTIAQAEVSREIARSVVAILGAEWPCGFPGLDIERGEVYEPAAGYCFGTPDDARAYAAGLCKRADEIDGGAK
jgi:hypothetical protein